MLGNIPELLVCLNDLCVLFATWDNHFEIFGEYVCSVASSWSHPESRLN